MSAGSRPFALTFVFQVQEACAGRMVSRMNSQTTVFPVLANVFAQTLHFT